MRVRLTTLLLLLLICWTSAGLQARAAVSSVSVLLQEANTLYANAKDTQALRKFEEVLKAEPACYEALWKASLLNSRIGNRFSDQVSKLQYFENAWRFADAALCANPGDAEANYVMALAVYNKSLVLGLKERMQRTKVIKFYLDEALCANPQHADAWQLMGRWHFKNANLSLPERSAFNLFFGGAPLEATNEQAAEALQKAINFNPNNISYYYDLAIVYKELQKEDLSIVTLQEAIDLQLLTSEELEISRRCKNMLNEMNKA
ncbi:tetratricopeptide repeat protein [Adhaeribacter sp. BT258]|uniref:Regulator of microtubule dynamics protein 1 n=1 Tax=Adhaeribacter terrigena TaxID=2793070 RepID=A0ABS1C0B7_9BACT|nr:tetratricopeptide repeat protein [Adhaeribacter terrigena]MBK0402849.1 tetratricopeptide repeat protein [Adhaeribacter terrigena]